VDRGFSSDANLAYLRRAGGHWIAGERMRDGSATPPRRCRARAATRPCATTCGSKRSGWTAPLTGVGSCATTPTKRPGTRPSATRPSPASKPSSPPSPRPEPATLPARRRPARRPATTRTAAPSAPYATTPRSAATCARAPPGGQVNRAAIRAEQRLDGKYLLSTSDPDLSAENVALGYKNLLEAERGFRDLKSTLELRPVFHRLEGRIRAHVLLCWLGLLLIRVAERRCGTTWRRIATELGRVHAVTLTGTAGTVVQTTPPSDTATSFLAACGIDPLPRITHLDPA
jgi:hypothetical protein